MGQRMNFVLFVLVILSVRKEVEGSYIETNEISPINVNERHDYVGLPACGRGSICGFLQVNSRGINEQAICACDQKSGQICPMTWDSYDGHSITQGSDQYKFCGEAPAVNACKMNELAYTSRIAFSKLTEETVSKSDFIHCHCPDTHNYELSNQEFIDLDANTEAMDLAYNCVHLRRCNMQKGEYCKTVSSTPKTFLVNRNCDCEEGLKCPTLTGNGKTEKFGIGLIHYIRCQP